MHNSTDILRKILLTLLFTWFYWHFSHNLTDFIVHMILVTFFLARFYWLSSSHDLTVFLLRDVFPHTIMLTFSFTRSYWLYSSHDSIYFLVHVILLTSLFTWSYWLPSSHDPTDLVRVILDFLLHVILLTSFFIWSYWLTSPPSLLTFSSHEPTKSFLCTKQMILFFSHTYCFFFYMIREIFNFYKWLHVY